LNLPLSYYQNYVTETLPSPNYKEWYIRPHHLETLTEHPKSIKDDVLNTNYYSYYNVDEGKPKEEKS